MAKICGLELRNAKKFDGVEGEMIQGDVYLNSDKIGFWSQDSWGGPDQFDFDDRRISENKLNDLIASVMPPATYMGYTLSYSLDLLMEDLYNLGALQDDWKKHAKKGDSLMIIADFPDEMTYLEYFFPEAFDSGISERKVRDGIEKDPKNDGKRVEYYVFTGDSDFEFGESLDVTQFIEEKEVV